MSSPKGPSGSTTKQLRSLYKGSIQESETKLDVSYNGPFGIVDPRFVGLNYVSYMFIESKSNLDDGFGTDRDAFRDGEEEEALMLGSVLGEYDFIHRRADASQYIHAGFSVNTIDDDEDFAFVANVESYPVFSVARWHGHNIRPDNITLEREPDEIPRRSLTSLEVELLYEMIHNPESNPEVWKENIINRTSDKREESLITEQKVQEKIGSSNELRGFVDALRGNYHLGKSIELNIPGIVSPDLNYAIIGLSVEEGVDIREDEAISLPNEEIMFRLRDEFDGWRMPYIVSGVGKGWGDILVEMHIEDVQEMNGYANRMRDIGGIDESKTFIVTESNFNRPFIPEKPGHILNRKEDVQDSNI